MKAELALPEMQTRKRWLLIAFTLLVLITLLESGARVALSRDVIANRLVRANDETSFRIIWSNRHRGGVNAQYKFDRHDPTKGWGTFPNLRDLPVFADKRLSTNRFGYRGSLNLTPAKKSGWRRIIVLGDSFTFGEEVNDDETYSHLLGQTLAESKIEVVNLGVHGYGHDQMLILLREFGVTLSPDLVVLGFIYKDVVRNGLSFRDYAKPRFDWNGDTLELRNSPIPPPVELKRRERWRSRLFDLALMSWRRVDHALGWGPKRERELTGQLLNEIARVSEAGGAKSLFAYLPSGGELAKPRVAAAHERFLLKHCAENTALTCGSLLPLFRSRIADGERFRGGLRHWSVDGHRVVAEGLAALIEERGLLE